MYGFAYRCEVTLGGVRRTICIYPFLCLKCVVTTHFVGAF